MDQSVLSYCVIYRMDQYILNFVFFKKIYSDRHNHSSDRPWLVVTGIDYYSSIAMGPDDVIIPIATILL
jgi:hypothetical protein